MGHVSINGKDCWQSQAFKPTDTSQECGRGGEGDRTHDSWREESVRASCQADAVDGKISVRVWADLDDPLDDESFGITNVVLTKVITSATFTFDNKRDFEGWNCGEITTCGNFGQLCGGFKTTGRERKIQQTFAVSPGEYIVSLDFIKIDSW